MPEASAAASPTELSADIAIAGRNTVTVRSGAASRHSSASCSTEPSWRA